MRKSFLMLGAAIVAMTSCTQSEVLEVAQQPEKLIGFAPFVDKQTRATDDITDDVNSGFQEFYVFGAKGSLDDAGSFTKDNETSEPYYLDHVMVSGGKGNWSYSPHKPWIADKTFRFAAYANGKGNGVSENSEVKLPDYDAENTTSHSIQFVPNESKIIKEETKDESGEIIEAAEIGYVWGLNINNYTASDRDLIAAIPGQKTIGEDLTTAPPSVGLTFKHLLAKVIIQFRYTANANNAALSLEVEPFSFSAYKTGNCQVRFTGVENNTVIGANWNGFENQNMDTYNLFEQVSQGESGGQVNQSWNSGNIQSEVYVIPQSNENIIIEKISIPSKNNNNEETSLMVYENVSLKIENHTNWLPGYVYRYIADITPGEHYIHFTTSVTSWIDEDNRNQTITGGTQQEQ